MKSVNMIVKGNLSKNDSLIRTIIHINDDDRIHNGIIKSCEIFGGMYRNCLLKDCKRNSSSAIISKGEVVSCILENCIIHSNKFIECHNGEEND